MGVWVGAEWWLWALDATTPEGKITCGTLNSFNIKDHFEREKV